jgi:hypothetical protein
MRTTHITAPKTQLNIGIALQWAADPHAEVFFTTIADIIREIENPEQWLKNNELNALNFHV